MEPTSIRSLLAVANYPSPLVMGISTLVLVAFIFVGGYWMKGAEEKARAKEKAMQKQDS